MICKKCHCEFKTRQKINGVVHNFKNRKYCLICSPFKKHNTKRLHILNNDRKCSCGETDPKKFYGHKKSICGKCHSKNVTKKGKEKKKHAIKFLGGECIICGFKEYDCSLDIHHTNPKSKDPNFRSKRGWSIERLEKELCKCVLLCKNHHQAVHNGDLLLQ